MRYLITLLLSIIFIAGGHADAANKGESQQVKVLHQRIHHLRADRNFWEDKARELMAHQH